MDTDFLYKGLHQYIQTMSYSPVPSSILFTPHKVVRHQIMLLFAILLSPLFFFPGFAAAGEVTAPGCLASWAWVRMLLFPP